MDPELIDDIIRTYRRDMESKYVQKTKVCVICKKSHVILMESRYPINPLGQTEACWIGGTVAKLDPGYGSKFDLDTYLVAICDECLEQAIADNNVTDLASLKHQMIEDKQNINLL